MKLSSLSKSMKMRHETAAPGRKNQRRSVIGERLHLEGETRKARSQSLMVVEKWPVMQVKTKSLIATVIAIMTALKSL